MERPTGQAGAAAYGGPGWSPRRSAHRDEIGVLWGAAGLCGEWQRLTRVVLASPGPALASGEPDALQLLAPIDLARAEAEHAALAAAYEEEGVDVVAMAPSATKPNAIFCADLFAMTPDGAILARPASTVRAGEEVAMAATLAAHGVPILATLTGCAVFEGADLIWAAPDLAVLGIGLRTNAEAAEQIASVLGAQGVRLETVDLPVATMHLMGMLRVFDRDLAIAWPGRTPHRAVEILRAQGMSVAMVPDDLAPAEIATGLNAVTLSPRRILMPGGCPGMRAVYQGLDIEVRETPTGELAKAAGAVGCLTGVLAREMTSGSGA